MADIGTLKATLTANQAPLKRNLRMGEDAFRRYSSRARMQLSKVRAAVLNVKTAIVGMIGVFAGAMAARAFLRFGMDFERTMSVVQVVSQATAAEMDELRASAKRLGETTEFTASQAGKALKFLAMAGLSVKQQLVALPQMLDLATSGQIDLARAADISTNILAQMGMEVEELNRVNDALVAVQSTANTNIEEAARAFIYAGTKAREFGIDVFELNAMIGILANRGLKAAMAGTTIRQAIIRLYNPTTDATKIMKKYGIEIQNADGSIRDFLDVLKEMSRAQLNSIEINKIFGARAGNISIILRAGVPALEAYIAKLRSMEGVSKSAAETIRSDVLGSFHELVSVLQSVVLDVWELYSNRIQNTIKTLSEGVRRHKESVVNSIEAVGDAFAAAWRIISSIPVGAIEFLEEVQIQAEATAEAVQMIAPPEKTAWRSFISFLDKWGWDIVRVFTFVGKTVGAILGNAVLSVAELMVQIGRQFVALFKGLTSAGERFAKAFRLIWTGIFSLDPEKVKAAFADLAKVWDGVGQDFVASTYKYNQRTTDSWNAMITSISKNWETMLQGMDPQRAMQVTPPAAIEQIIEPVVMPEMAAFDAASQATEKFVQMTKEEFRSLEDTYDEWGIAAMENLDKIKAAWAEWEALPDIGKSLLDIQLESLKVLHDIPSAVKSVSKEYAAMMTKGIQLTEDMLTPLEKYTAALKLIGELYAVDAIGVETYYRAIAAAAEEYQKFANVVDERTKRMKGYAEDFGDSFIRIMEEATAAGTWDFKKMVSAMIAELQRLILQMVVFDRIRSAVTGFIGGFFGGGKSWSASDVAGGFKPLQHGGSFGAGQPIMVGEAGPEVLVPGMAGTIIPNNALGGDKVEYNQIINVSPGVAEVVRREMMAMMPWMRRSAVEAMMQAIGRGGAAAKSVGAR